MIELTYADIRSPGCNSILQRLAQVPLPVVEARKIREIIAQVSLWQRNAEDDWHGVLKTYFNESGGVLTPKEIDLALYGSANTAVQDFNKRKVEITVVPLSHNLLNEIKVTALEVTFLDRLINPQPEPSDSPAPSNS